MKLELKRPCSECPFKNDLSYQRGWLGKQRAEGIIKSLYEKDQSFPCHKTTGGKTGKKQHCAGAMILMERSGRANQFMRIGERTGFYDRNQLNMDTPVFDTPEQFISWHSGSEVITEYQMRKAKAEQNASDCLQEEESAVKVSKDTAQWFSSKQEQMKAFLVGIPKSEESNG